MTIEVKVNKKKASSTLYFILFFIIFLAFCAFAVDGTIVFTNRAKLQSITETAALAGAEMFNSDNDPSVINPSERNTVESVARGTFDLLKQGGLKTAEVDSVVADPVSPKVTLVTKMVSQPFFLSFLGVSGINLSAQAKAKSEDMSIFGGSAVGIRWATKRAVYQADVITNDSAVLKSLGTDASLSYSSSGVNYDFISTTANQPLNLGPGGFVTIKLPVPIIDKPGYDLEIIESGLAKEGYMVFAGLDNDPNNPYIDHTNPGPAGLSWVNISCTGDSKEITNPNPVYRASNTNLPDIQTKFYGSGYFDIGKTCDGYAKPVSMVKYIRIIDDNSESAFVETDGIYYKSMFYGESSTNTPGADIDAVKVLNYVHLTQD